MKAKEIDSESSVNQAQELNKETSSVHHETVIHEVIEAGDG